MILSAFARAALLGVLCTLSLAPVAAQPTAQPNEAVTALVGPWEISNADRDQTCMLALKADTAPGGYKVEFDKTNCVGKFPPLKDVAAWALIGDNTVRLIDARGRAIYDFTEVESGMYEALRPGQPLTFLQTAASVAEAVRTVEQMMGEWSIVRGTGEICVLALSNTVASPGEMALQVRPGCDTSITRFGPVTWQFDQGELVMKSARGQIWRFEDNNGVWERRIPREAEALMLTRR